MNDQHHSNPVHCRASIQGKRGTILFEITEPNVQVTGQDVDVLLPERFGVQVKHAPQVFLVEPLGFCELVNTAKSSVGICEKTKHLRRRRRKHEKRSSFTQETSNDGSDRHHNNIRDAISCANSSHLSNMAAPRSRPSTGASCGADAMPLQLGQAACDSSRVC